jgi:hypothetical protein
MNNHNHHHHHSRRHHIIIIIIGKTDLFEPWPSLEDSTRLHPVFTSFNFETIYFS